MLYEVEISETYEYTTFINAEDEKELQKIIHEQTPTLLNMTKKQVKKIMNDKQANFQRFDEFTWYERG